MLLAFLIWQCIVAHMYTCMSELTAEKQEEQNVISLCYEDLRIVWKDFRKFNLVSPD